MLPFSLGCAVTSAVAGIIVSRTGQYRPMMWGSFAVFTLGMGLMTMLDSHSSTYVFFPLSLWDFSFTLQCRALKVVYPLVAAVGLGCLFQVCVKVASLLRFWAYHVQTPLIGLQAAMPIKDMATSTSTFGFIRQVFLTACHSL